MIGNRNQTQAEIDLIRYQAATSRKQALHGKTMDVNRVEVINHFVDESHEDFGRKVYVNGSDCVVELSLQDDLQTLKIFLSKPRKE